VNSTVHLSFRYTERDYVRALRAHYKSRLRLPLDIVVVAALAAIGVYLWPSWWGIASLVVSVLFLLMLVATFAVIPALAFRREAKLRDDYLLTFSPEGIHFRTAHIDSQLIPKRVFGSVGDEQAFEGLLVQYVAAIARQSA